jgi:protein-S-isoprenylcysteine O-methyltransferase Ste14
MKTALAGDAIEPRMATARSLDLGIDGTSPAIRAGRAPSRDVADFLAKLIVVSLFSFMAVRLGADFFATGRLTGLLLLASEALVVVLTVFRRAPAVVNRSMRARVLTTLSLLGPPLVKPALVAPLMPEALTVAASALGLMVVIGGKISLGRSFGLIPANRGIVSTGFYRLVRHPIYLGYLVTHAAFLAANPTMWNLALMVTADIALMARAVCEEQTLALDDAYKAYQTRVRWRVVPGLF